MKKIVLLSVLICQIGFSQSRSQSGPVVLEGKFANGFTIELSQNLEFVTQLFNTKFEIDRLGEPKKLYGTFNAFFQIESPKISNSFLDFYYNFEEIKSDNGVRVKITLLISKGYDNFISKENDVLATSAILDALNDLGISVERKNYEVQIAKKELEIQSEKQKLLMIEEELRTLENEKNEVARKITKVSTVLNNQAKTTQELGNELQKLKNTLSDFEKGTSHKSKGILKSVSKQ